MGDSVAALGWAGTSGKELDGSVGREGVVKNLSLRGVIAVIFQTPKKWQPETESQSAALRREDRQGRNKGWVGRHFASFI